MNYETLSFESNDGIGLLKVNRPQALNALNSKLLSELDTFLSESSWKKNTKVLMVTGEGEKAFVAGADIKEMQERSDDSGSQMAFLGQKVFGKLEGLDIPSIAVINGFALGGGLELALACDIIIASSKARVGLPEVSLGLIPGYGGTQRLSRCIGKSRAKMMALTGDIFSAEEAYSWGLFSRLIEPDKLLEEATRLAKTLTTRSPRALELAKKAVDRGFDLTLADGLKCEASYFGEAFASEDKKEGVAAFIEKRTPKFTGK